MVLQLYFQNYACYIINPAIGGQVMMDIMKISLWDLLTIAFLAGGVFCL